jgi:hypothetical protein
LNPQIVVNILHIGLLVLFNVTLNTLPVNIVAIDFSMVVADTNSNGFDDSAVVSFSSIVNNPTVQGTFSNQVVLVFSTVVATSPLNAQGTQLNMISQFTFSNSTTTIAESAKSINIQVVAPILQ